MTNGSIKRLGKILRYLLEESCVYLNALFVLSINLKKDSMKKTEIALIVFVLITTLNLMLVAGASALMVIMLLLLSSLYLFFGFALFNGIRLRNVF